MCMLSEEDAVAVQVKEGDAPRLLLPVQVLILARSRRNAPSGA